MEYKDGKGDKIGMPCTESTVIKTCNSQPKRINDTSPILSRRHTVEGVVVEIHVPCVRRLVCLS